MKNLYHRKSESGMGMISAVIALGAIVTISLAVSTSLSQIYKQTESVKRKSQATMIMSDIDTLLQDRELCGRALQNIVVGTGAVVNTTRAVDITIPNTSIRLAEGQILDNNFRVERAELSVLGTAPTVIPVWNGAEISYHQYEAQMKISLSVTDGNNSGEGLRPMIVHLKLMTDQTGRVSSCSNRSLEMANCAAGGGIWDLTTTSEELRCAPLDHCRNMGSFTQADAPADLRFANAFTGQYNCPTGSREYLSSFVYGYQASGKYSSTSQRYNVYNCIQCGPNAPGPNNPAAPSAVSAFDFSGDVDEIERAVNGFCSAASCGPPPTGTCSQENTWTCQPKVDNAPWQCACQPKYTDVAVNPASIEPCADATQTWQWTPSPAPARWSCRAVPPVVGVACPGDPPTEIELCGNYNYVVYCNPTLMQWKCAYIPTEFTDCFGNLVGNPKFVNDPSYVCP